MFKQRYECLILVLFFSISFAEKSNPKNNIDNERLFVGSRVIIGDGAKVIIDRKASAKLIYDELDLLKYAKYVTLEEEQIQSENNEKFKESNVQSEALPTEFTISKAFPNPFNPIVSISYGLPKTVDVKIFIYDLSGRKVLEYTFQNQTAGWHNFQWNALDEKGQSIGSGVYLLTIRAGDMIKKQKITYLR